MGNRILIADDAAIMRATIKTILADSGFDIVAEAANGVEAVERYKQHQPDAVTMDLVMPKLDGINALKEIIAEFPAAKIIMCSSMGQQNLVIEAIRAGAKGFITKPFEPEKLVETVKRLVA